MYSTRLSGGATRSEASSDAQPTPCVVTSLTHTIDTLPKPDNFKRRKKENPEVKDKKDNYRHRIQIGMFRPIRVDHTKCLQVAIKKSSSYIITLPSKPTYIINRMIK